LTKSLKVCIVTPHFPPKISGMAVSVFEMRRKLLEMGCEVHLVVPTFFKPKFEHKLLVRPITYSTRSQSESDLCSHFCKRVVYVDKSTISFGTSSARKVQEIVEKNGLDVVHVHSSFDDNYIADYLGAKVKEELRGIPTILTVHGGGRKSSSRESNVWKLVPNLFDKVIVVSRGLKNELLALGFSPNKIMVIPNGVDLERFNTNRGYSEVRKKYRIENKQPVILFAGRLDPDKGVTYLLSAFMEVLRRLPDAKLFLAGSGCLGDFIKEIVVELRLQRSTIIESFSHEDIAGVYEAVDVVVLPSVQRDACPLAVLEAMASRKPVVASNVPGITEIVKSNDTGLLVSPKDSHQLANAIVKLLTNRKLASSLAEKGYKRVKKCYDINSSSKRIVRVYQEAYVRTNK